MKKSSLFIVFLVFFICSCETETYHQGRILYENFCQNCHMADGTGLKNVIPPLKNSEFLKNNQSSLTCLIRKGTKDTINVNGKIFKQPMPGSPKLTQGDITNIINYINQAWGNNYGIIKYDDVLKQFESCR
ncbi:MAG: cytochrome c [Saprospiraceae bacterium]|nr:cytochrome c [Saprospiraceae bacterium]